MSTGRDANVITVSALDARATRGWLRYGALHFPCSLGRGGRRALKRETDGASPVGLWPLRRAFYRADRLVRPQTLLPLQPLPRQAGWCDAASDRNYNRPVTHPYKASAEEMWRSDELYDIVVVLGHNDLPRVKGLGSAIFMHVAREGYLPTEGCVGLHKRHLICLLARLRPRVHLRITA